ncbi:MAG: TIGR03545 family protein [Candidatus Margulisbacteria bacterium]|jgi:uncharacterized protein (TIGR03545 family)|nr:TIGR03545 family protein [Candidatus Margulisiibacteriota bacterium]
MLNFKKTIPVLAVLILLVGGFNPLLQLGLQKAGNAAFGAKTEIAGFSLNPLTGRLQIRQLAVANKDAPFTNLFEVGNFTLELSPEQALYKRVVIGRSTIDNIRLGTPRSTSGALAKKPPKAQPEKPPLDLAKLAANLELQPDAVQNALQVAPPQAQAAAVRIQKENERLLAGAQKQLASVDVAQELAALKLDELSEVSLSSLDDLKKLQALAEEKQKGLNKLAAALEASKTAGESALQAAQKNLAELDAVRKQDMANLLSALDLGSYDLGALGRELLGPKINGWLDTGTHYFALLQKYMPPKKAKPEKKKKTRLQGETIVFPDQKTRPRFYIGLLGLNGVSGEGTANELTYRGQAADLASEQALIGRPAVIEIAGAFTRRADALLNIKAVFDRRETARDKLDFTLSGFDLTGQQFWDEQTIPLKITGGLGRIEAVIAIDDDVLSGKISFLGKNLRYAQVPGAEGLPKLAAGAIAAAPELRIDILLGGTPAAPDIRLTTNLDALIKARLEKELGDQLARVQQQVEAEYIRVVGSAQAEAGAALAKQQKALQEELAAQQAALDSARAGIEQRKQEAEDRLRQQTDALQKQAEDALKNALPNLKF